MLHPLFDQNCELMAWIEPGRHIFDSDRIGLPTLQIIRPGLLKTVTGWGRSVVCYAWITLESRSFGILMNR
jgi:hypothetical protein